MTLRYLFGPVTPAFADQNLHLLRQGGACLAFGYTAGPAIDAVVTPGDTWDDLLGRLPAGWRPDFAALYLPYTTIPAGLWSAPVPLVGLAGDWNLLWHHYRQCLPRCDLAFTDAAGVDACQREGLTHVQAGCLYGLERAYLEPAPEVERDIDVLFVGNLHSAVQRARLAWLGRLARLPGRRVHIATHVFGADYRALLRRAKIVFNRAIRGECNRRAFEAAACGALVFNEAGNREIADYFQERVEFVSYRDDDLEALLEYYLDHEEERAVLAAAGRRRALACTFEALWRPVVGQVETAWAAVGERSRTRQAPTAAADLIGRTWQLLGSGQPATDPGLADALAAAAAVGPAAPPHTVLGVVQALAAGSGPLTPAVAGSAARCFHQALTSDPAQPVAALNLIEALAGLNQTELAIQGARRTLARLDAGPELPAGALDLPHFPPAYDTFRVEWERAAWAYAGDRAAEARAKAELLRWRLHTLLAELTGELVHYHEAALARSDLPSARAALGCALARAGRTDLAVGHLHRAVAADPFDRDAARALCQALRDTGATAEASRVVRDRRRLYEAAPQVVPADAWFLDAPAADGLASLVILCCDQLEFTRQCLESVRRHTRPPYELVLVDNGSTDGTPAYLADLAARPGPQRVLVLRNEHNVGFPAGCNQGLARAQGEYVVFLNNDIIVTPGWLDGLVAAALRDGADVGLVGAVSNYTRPPQQVEAGYANLSDLDAFADRRRRTFAGQTFDVERLTGFCLLARRAVLDKLGGFDERFGLGFFDDDDLSVRARQAGYRLRVALDVFVHHFGSRTFTGLGVDCPAQLRANFEQFKAKWGPEHSAGYRLPQADLAGASVPPITTVDTAGLAPVGRPRVTLTMIVKNEEHNLPDCLASAADLFDEIVVIDTGSTDRTKEVAARFEARVFDFPWCDDFAAARNEALRHATGDWVFWLDADDRLDGPNRERLRALLGRLAYDNAAYCLKCLCVPDQATGTATVVDHIRLFRNHPHVRWHYRVHEQILPAIRQQGGEVRWADVVVRHTGYQDAVLRGKKLERDLRLLRLEDADRPDDPFTLFNLGSVYQELGRHAEALPLLRRSLERSHPRDSIVRKLYALIASCHRQLGQAEEALAACREGLAVCPDDAELLFVEGTLHRDRGDLAGAEAALARLLGSRPADHFASVDAGLRGYKARHNLAVTYQDLGRPADAEAQWRQAAAGRPDFLPALHGLGELYLRAGRWDEVERLARGLEADAGAPVEAAVFRARAHLNRQEFPAAQALLRGAIAAAPHALWPRVILSHALLQEGRDPEAAEQALRDILAIDANNVEANNNLTVLLRSRQHLAADQVFAAAATLTQLYEDACRRPSDINEHLPTLYALARDCRHVTELGTRTGVSTTALLFAQPAKLVCYDRRRCPQVGRLAALAGDTAFVFHEADVLAVTIEETDLLFIDTWHVYDQLKEELRLHAGKARRYLVLHDTTTFGERGESEGHRGLWPAVEEFLARGTFRLKQRYENNNGLTVLEAVGVGPLANRQGPTSP